MALYRDLDPQRVAVIFHELQGAMLTNIAIKGSAPSYDRRKVNLAIDILLRGIEQKSAANGDRPGT